jgi:hypothetical protein
MANVPEASNFDEGVYQIEENDPVLGGAAGFNNRAAINLANRTRWLKENASIKGANDSFEAGVSMVFFNTAAPIGWTKSTTHSNRALRIVSGNSGGSIGGEVDFTSCFSIKSVEGSISNTTAGGSVANTTAGGSVGNTTAGGSVGSKTAGGSVSVANRTLSSTQTPSHRHYVKPKVGGAEDGNGYPTGWNDTFGGTINKYTDYEGGSSAHNHSATFSGSAHNHTFTGSAHNHTFSGTAHGHTFTGAAHGHTFTGSDINLAVKYVDGIICVRDAA